MAEAHDDLPERMVGRYRLGEPLGQGGVATVFRAVDSTTGESVALKLLQPGHGGSTQVMGQRMLREAELLHELEHPAIVKVLDCGVSSDGAVFVALELLEGEDLLQRIEGEGPMPWPEAVRIGIALGDALGTAHERGILHRDVKPSNIFLPTEPDQSAKLIDFGIARPGEGQKLTMAGEVVGTPAWMAPEQFYAHTDLDPRVDVYGLGLCIRYAIVGARPFSGEHETVVAAVLAGDLPKMKSVADVPKQLAAVLDRATASKAHKRPADGIELALQLAKAANIRAARSSPGRRRFTIEIDPADVRSRAQSAEVEVGSTRLQQPSPGSVTAPMPRLPTPARVPATMPKNERRALLLVGGGSGLVVFALVVALGVAWGGEQGAPTSDVHKEDVGFAPAPLEPAPPEPAPEAEPAPAVETTPTAPTKVVSRSRRVRLSSVPSDAAIHRDGEYLGQTPVVLRRPDEGYTLTLRLGGRLATVAVESDSPEELVIRLPRARRARTERARTPMMEPAMMTMTEMVHPHLRAPGFLRRD